MFRFMHRCMHLYLELDARPSLESLSGTGGTFSPKTVHLCQTLHRVRPFLSHELKLAYSSAFVLRSSLCCLAVYFSFNIKVLHQCRTR